MEHPKVSIIMNCLNGEEYLRQALDSVFGQTYDDWEIIFWDNASTDKSAAIASSYGERVRYFKSSVTHPLGKARNLAIKEAMGDFIAFWTATIFGCRANSKNRWSSLKKILRSLLFLAICLFMTAKRIFISFWEDISPREGKFSASFW